MVAACRRDYLTEGQEARLCEVCYGAGTKAGQREAKVKIKGA